MNDLYEAFTAFESVLITSVLERHSIPYTTQGFMFDTGVMSERYCVTRADEVWMQNQIAVYRKALRRNPRLRLQFRIQLAKKNLLFFGRNLRNLQLQKDYILNRACCIGKRILSSEPGPSDSCFELSSIIERLETVRSQDQLYQFHDRIEDFEASLD